MATIHMIHGFLGSGKSTFARKLAAELGAERFSPDERMVELHGIDPPEERFAGFLSTIYETISQEWPKKIALNQDVVLDFGFWTRAQRDEVRRRAQAMTAGTKLYAVRCSEETARKRCRDRNKDLRGSLFIADNTFEVLKKRFEPLARDEAFVLVDTEDAKA
jgi:predicted kinase